MKNLLKSASLLITVVAFLSSCNKDLETFAPISTPTYPSGSRIATTLSANPNYSFYNALITRAGMTALLNDSTRRFTLFATDNAGMKLFVNAASGGLVPLNAPDATFLGFISTTLPATSAAGIVQYNLLGGSVLSSAIPTTFPNYPYTSQIVLDPNQPFVRMPIFPVRGTPTSYVNTLPLTGVDMVATNGVIHTTVSVVTPPSQLLRQMINAESSLSYFRAAVLRADSGQIVKGTPTAPDSTNFFNYLLGYGVTNMTIFPPNDAAFQQLIYGLVYAKVFAATGGNATIANAQATGAVALGPSIFTNPVFASDLSPTVVRGIIAYHFLGSNSTPINTTGTYKPDIRVFSVNIPSTPTLVKTLVNGAVATHPGVRAVATYTGPFATSVQVTGVGTFPPGGAPFSGPAANVIAADKHAVNGVYHIIDRVLLPQ
ncbi:MAG: hypothetical protein KA319_09270 [Ferruginibacter sp.]|nr:hypothetical protein [Ferruginibacter sp.]